MNLEESLAYLEDLNLYEDSDSELGDEAEDLLGTDVVCPPPKDCEDTDKDDAPSGDEVDVNNPRHLGKGVLTMPAQIDLCKPHGNIVNFGNTEQAGPSSSMPRGKGPNGDRPQSVDSAARGNGPADPLVQMASLALMKTLSQLRHDAL